MQNRDGQFCYLSELDSLSVQIRVLLSTKKQKCGRVQFPLQSNPHWMVSMCLWFPFALRRKKESCLWRKEGWGISKVLMRYQLNYRQSVQKVGEAVYLRIQPRRTVETNKLFWLLWVKTCWWKRHRTSHWERREGSVKWDFNVVPEPLKLREDSWCDAPSLILCLQLPGATPCALPFLFATWSERRNVTSESHLYIDQILNLPVCPLQGLANNKMPLIP